jgi:hypothetical protein
MKLRHIHSSLPGVHILNLPPKEENPEVSAFKLYSCGCAQTNEVSYLLR